MLEDFKVGMRVRVYKGLYIISGKIIEIYKMDKMNNMSNMLHVVTDDGYNDYYHYKQCRRLTSKYVKVHKDKIEKLKKMFAVSAPLPTTYDTISELDCALIDYIKNIVTLAREIVEDCK